MHKSKNDDAKATAEAIKEALSVLGGSLLNFGWAAKNLSPEGPPFQS